MKKLALFLTLGLVAVACHRNRAPKQPARENQEPPPPATAATYEAPPPVATTSGGTCAASCTHYLQCKGNVDPNAHPACVTKCQAMNLTQQQLSQYEATDCATAIWQAENAGGTSGTGTKPSASECNGCVWDGSSCIWLSSGNWGAGPYSGAASSCKAYCCPGH